MRRLTLISKTRSELETDTANNRAKAELRALRERSRREKQAFEPLVRELHNYIAGRINKDAEKYNKWNDGTQITPYSQQYVLELLIESLKEVV